MGSFTVVIPARLASSRLERKALADLGGKPMVIRVAERSAQSAANRIIVATDAQEIESVCKAANLEVMMTREDHPSGTDRLAEVAVHAGVEAALAVRVEGRRGQGDDRHARASLARLGRAHEARRLEPVHAGHLQVHEDEVGLELGDSLQSLLAA